MTEPVAYLITSPNGEQQATVEKPDFGYIEKLYTVEQINHRIKMTSAEFNEWSSLYGENRDGSGNVYFGLKRVIENFLEYPNLNKKIITSTKNQDNLSQSLFANLWANYNPSKPEETIEMIQKKKWFVISIEKDDEGDYAFLSDIKVIDDWVYSKQHDFIDKSSSRAYSFDTKEEAEKWTTPLTEAVLLPVEES